ncbi:hypothetical protein ES708_20811 [subsurface metagenome]
MIKSNVMLCADNVIRDAETDLISIVGIAEDIIPEGLPLFIPRFMILIFLQRDDSDPSDIKCTLRITLNGDQLLEKTLTIGFKGKKRNRTIINIGGLPIAKQGILETSLWLDDKMLNQYKMVVKEPRKLKVEIQQEPAKKK